MKNPSVLPPKYYMIGRVGFYSFTIGGNTFVSKLFSTKQECNTAAWNHHFSEVNKMVKEA